MLENLQTIWQGSMYNALKCVVKDMCGWVIVLCQLTL